MLLGNTNSTHLRNTAIHRGMLIVVSGLIVMGDYAYAAKCGEISSGTPGVDGRWCAA